MCASNRNMVESITSPGPVCLLHSQLWSWHAGIVLNFLLAIQPTRFFLPAPQFCTITFSYLLFAESHLCKKDVWGLPGGNRFLCYNKNKNLWKAQQILCLPRKMCYVFCKRGSCCCCFCCCCTLPVDCGVDLVWVTLINCLLFIKTERPNGECDALPSLCHTMELQNWKLSNFLKSVYDTHAHTYTLQGLPFSTFTVLSCIGVAGRPRHILLSFCGCSSSAQAGDVSTPKYPVRYFKLKAHCCLSVDR